MAQMLKVVQIVQKLHIYRYILQWVKFVKYLQFCIIGRDNAMGTFDIYDAISDISGGETV